MAQKRLAVQKSTLTRIEVERALAFKQPGLTITELQDEILAEGEYIVTDGPHSDGPIARYQVCIYFFKNYPEKEPLVIETAGDIERIADRHMYSEGACCTCVWEEWLITADDTSISAFCEGPLNNFFLSQVRFDQTGKWPFGDRKHGAAGFVQSVGAIIGFDVDQESALRYLQALSARTIKGHWLCPCGSKEKLRKCCRDKVIKLRGQVEPVLAARLLKRLVDAIKSEQTIQ